MSASPFPRGEPVKKGEFNVNAFSRTNYDSCEVLQNINDSAGPGAYMVKNLVPNQAGAQKIASANPTMLGREGFGINNGAVDDDSKLRNDATKEGRQALFMFSLAPLPQYPLWEMVVGIPMLKARLSIRNLRA